MKNCFIFSLLSVLFIQCQDPKPNAAQEGEEAREIKSSTSDWDRRVVYEIFVQSFADGNGDGIGDFQGLTQKLDYLEDLGIGAIWLMPISPSPSYHKYDVTDYQDIHPDYGTKEDFKKFVVEAHARNIKIVIDLVINHSSRLHPWFQSAQKDPQSPYRDYYIWADSLRIAEIASEARVEEDTYQDYQWREAPGNTEKYYGFFSEHMPDFNYDNPKVRQEMIDIARFWLEEMQIDGFRLDGARHIYLDNSFKKSAQWWLEFKEAVQKIKPGTYLVGEVWAEGQITQYFSQGLPSLFNFDLAQWIQKALQEERADSLGDRLQEIRERYLASNANYQDAIFLSNHDQNRIMSQLAGNMEKAKLAANLLFTLPGIPYVYYGEELGMRGQKPDPEIREPFPWAEKSPENCTWIERKHNALSLLAPLSIQKQDSLSLFHHYRSWIHLRNQSPALRTGDFESISTYPKAILAFYRQDQNQKLLILHNLHAKALEISLLEQEATFSKMIYPNSKNLEADQVLNIKPYQSIILSQNP